MKCPNERRPGKRCNAVMVITATKEIKHNEWRLTSRRYKCTVCGASYWTIQQPGGQEMMVSNRLKEYGYCECGILTKGERVIVGGPKPGKGRAGLIYVCERCKQGEPCSRPAVKPPRRIAYRSDPAEWPRWRSMRGDRFKLGRYFYEITV